VGKKLKISIGCKLKYPKHKPAPEKKQLHTSFGVPYRHRKDPVASVDYDDSDAPGFGVNKKARGTSMQQKN
jgi:hypothetical protein